MMTVMGNLVKRGTICLAGLLLWSSAALAQTLSPDGSVLRAEAPGSLVTSAGTWTFDKATGVGGNLILLNGRSAGNGSAVELDIANGGQIYALALGQWWKWDGSAWPASVAPTAPSPPPAPPPSIPPPVILGFAAERTSVTLTWMTDQNTDSCKGDNFQSGDFKDGMISFNPSAGVTKFTLTCTGPGGSTSAAVELPK